MQARVKSLVLPEASKYTGNTGIGADMDLIDRDMLLDWLEDERDVCLQHNNFVGAGEVSYIRKHVMEIGGMNDKGGNEDE